jgi:ubiquitin C-terminal hydrolase
MFGGITNIGGTTCALNTLIQLIVHANKLYDGLLTSFVYDRNSENKKSLVWNITFVCDALKNGHSINPGGLVRLIYELFPDYFHPGEQMDIYELWMLISNKIADEVAVNKKEKLIHPKNIDPFIYNKVKEDVRKMNNGKSSPWLKNIQSIQLGVLKCLNQQCGDTPWNVELFNSFQVDIPLKNDVDNPIVLDKLLLNNHTIEKLPEWKCDKCSHVGGIKQSQVYTLPQVLMITIKRFRITEVGQFKKINTPVNISTHITIELNGVPTNYKLVGIGNHYGVYGGGHYNAFVLEENMWICFDDNMRNVINLDQNNIFLQNKTAYMVCYELV